MSRQLRPTSSRSGLATLLAVVVGASGIGVPAGRAGGDEGLLTAKVAGSADGEATDMAGDAASEAWPFLRGPNYDGHVRTVDLVDALPAGGPPVLWTRPLGQGYSGCTAAGSRVYTQYQTLEGQFVVALNADTGETVWRYRYDWPYDPAGLYPGPRGTPTLAGGLVLFATPDGLLGCLAADSGNLLWSDNLFERFGVEPVEFGYSCSPVVVDGVVFAPVGAPGASMVALRARTGEVVWHAGDDPVSHVPALPIAIGGRRLVIGYFRNVLAAFDRGTGEQVWRVQISEGYDEHAAWPIYREPHLWIAGPFHAGSELFELAADPPACRPVWKSRILSNDVCSSVLVDGSLYGFDLRDVQTKPHRPSRGQFRCVDFLTGIERWSTGSPGARRTLDAPTSSDDRPNEPVAVGHASVLHADGKLILWNDLGELILARANPERYEELGRISVLGGEICWTQPTLYRGRLYVRNQTRMACLDLGSRQDGAAAAFRPALTVADIPQERYRDWAAILLPVEPEFAMDVPTLDQLRSWYLACLAGLAAALVVAALLSLAHASFPFRMLLIALTFIYGAVAGTMLSPRMEMFLFTWPLCIYATLHVVVLHAAWSRRSVDDSPWRGRLALAAFVVVCLAYYLLCRRLSLAAELVFLIGIPAAVPLVAWSRSPSSLPGRQASHDGLAAVAGFSAYYWASVAVLFWKYPG